MSRSARPNCLRLPLVGVLLAVLAAQPAVAAVFAVNSVVDARDVAAGDGICATAAGLCTLRAAIEESNALAGADSITLPAGVYLITFGNGDDNAAKGDFDVTDVLTITGAGEPFSIVDGNAADRVFDVRQGARLEMSSVTVRNGNKSPGGGIRCESALVLTDVTVANNIGKDGGGVAVKKDGSTAVFTNVSFLNNISDKGGGLHVKDQTTITIIDSYFSGNTADKDGGGTYFEKSIVTISDTVFENNTAEKGGGLFIKNNNSNVAMINSTISGNTASKEGGGVHTDDGITQLSNVTVNANSSPDGGGLFHKGGSLLLQNTIVSNSTGADCSGTISSQGNNLATDGSCQLVQAGDLPNTAPLLGPLQDNGGQTLTHGLLDFSPARDGGNNAACLTTDQRGWPRPVDGNGDGIATCDIGAFEADPLFPDYYLQKTVATVSDPYSGTTNPKTIPGAVIQYTIGIDNAGPGAADQGTLIIVDAVPPDTALVVTDFDGANPGPVAFVDGAPASGLAYSFISLASAADDIEFSNDGGTSFGYTPTADANGTDADVTHIRVRPAGTARFTGSDPVAEFRFNVAVR